MITSLIFQPVFWHLQTYSEFTLDFTDNILCMGVKIIFMMDVVFFFMDVVFLTVHISSCKTNRIISNQLKSRRKTCWRIWRNSDLRGCLRERGWKLSALYQCSNTLEKNSLMRKSWSLLLASMKYQGFTFTALAYCTCFEAISATGSSVWKSCPGIPDLLDIWVICCVLAAREANNLYSRRHRYFS